MKRCILIPLQNAGYKSAQIAATSTGGGGVGGLADRTDKYWISFQIHAVIIFEGFEKKRVFAFG